MFQKVPPATHYSPFAGLQFFRQVDIDGCDDAKLKDIAGMTVYDKELQPFAPGPPSFPVAAGAG